jgi:hypothetical protein
MKLRTALLAIGDMVSTYTNASLQLRQLHRRQAELEHAARRLQQDLTEGPNKER